MFYPIKFKEIYKKKIWGGNESWSKINKKAPPNTGECWEISDIDGHSSIVENGRFKGQKLSYLLKKYPKEIMGDEIWIKHQRFPLLVKFLWAKDKLSLQVHPGDEFAQKYELSQGKMEVWHILHSSDDARIIRGVLPGTTEQELRESLNSGNLDSHILNIMKVKENDTIFIPPGTVHSAYGGTLILEFQQASDITYRLSDWQRVDFNKRQRKLDVEKGIKVIDFQSMGVSKVKPQRISGYSYKRKLLIKCEKFTVESMELKYGAKATEKHDHTRFKIFSIINGKGTFHYGAKKENTQQFKMGQTYLIPAALGSFDVKSKGNTIALIAFI